MKKRQTSRGLVLALAGLGAVLWPAAASAQVESNSLSVLTGVLRGSAIGAEVVLRQVAVPMAVSLATIEVVVYALKKATRLELHRLAIRLAILAFFIAAAANNTPNLSAREIVRGAEEIAKVLSGLDGFNPSKIVDQGLYFFGRMFRNLLDLGLLTEDVNDIAAHYLAAFGTLFAFVLVALQVTLTLIQGSYLLALSPLFMAFGASRWTISATEGYVNVILWWSIKVIVLGITLSIGDYVATIIDSTLRGTSILGFHLFARSGVDLQVMTFTLGYAAAAAFIPGMLSSKLNVQIRISQLLGD